MSPESEITILTVGHSTRTLPEFINLLNAYKVTLIVDVRTIPRSRHNPHFNKETLPDQLKIEDIKYIHMPELGGLRRSHNDSSNTALRERGFQGYADYMQTKEFTENLLKLIAIARENQIAIMCAEALPWRCHRALLCDALTIRNIKVEHILNTDHKFKHELNPNASVEGTKITYPLYSKETPQRTLTDFPASN